MCPMSQGDGRNPSSSNQTTPQEDYTHTIVVGQQSAVQPRANVPRRSGGAKDGKLQEDDDGSNLLAALQQACFENYHTFAYTIIIGSYFIAFCLYLYLRLISWIFPQKIIYKRHCQKHENETIVRMELHYASATATFLVMATFQLVCFFFLTISSKWLEVRRTFTNFVSMEERLRNELVFAIKRVMFVTVLPSFVVYLLSSIVVTLAIFYMVGMRDSVNHVGSQVIIYFFDGCIRRKLQTAQRRTPNCSSRPDPQPAISVDIRQVPAASHQRSQAESSIPENPNKQPWAQEAQLPLLANNHNLALHLPQVGDPVSNNGLRACHSTPQTYMQDYESIMPVPHPNTDGYLMKYARNPFNHQ
uniref:Uncharacterized protein n=1 Tax=Ditylenchus dipsaci TaxID=166011 RepID=A0A915CLT2_9BILA